MRVTTLSIFFMLLGIGLLAALVGPRSALWHVVQACVLAQQAVDRPFPCLLVDTSKGRNSGYAVLRSPIDDVKIIVAPTARTTGIEDPRLRGPLAPNYFADAWAARHFATDGLTNPPGDDNLALALNSRPGRSQDQLHIHVACLFPGVKNALDREASRLSTQAWTRMKPLPRSPYYLAHLVAGRDLTGTNVIDLATEGLKLRPPEIDDMTIVVAATAAAPTHPAGFTILTRKRISKRDNAHGEALLDQDCGLAKGS